MLAKSQIFIIFHPHRVANEMKLQSVESLNKNVNLGERTYIEDFLALELKNKIIF